MDRGQQGRQNIPPPSFSLQTLPSFSIWTTFNCGPLWRPNVSVWTWLPNWIWIVTRFELGKNQTKNNIFLSHSELVLTVLKSHNSGQHFYQAICYFDHWHCQILKLNQKMDGGATWNGPIKSEGHSRLKRYPIRIIILFPQKGLFLDFHSLQYFISGTFFCPRLRVIFISDKVFSSSIISLLRIGLITKYQNLTIWTDRRETGFYRLITQQRCSSRWASPYKSLFCFIFRIRRINVIRFMKGKEVFSNIISQTRFPKFFNFYMEVLRWAVKVKLWKR